MKPKKNCVIFYNEIMSYTEGLIRELSHEFNLIIVAWGKDKKLTNYQASLSSEIKFIEENSLGFISGIVEFIRTVRIDLLIVNGWTTKKYLIWALLRFKHKCPCVVTLDGQINNDKKFVYKALRKSNILKLFFSHALVAGPRQEQYAAALGFGADQTIKGFLSADYKVFASPQNTDCKQKEILYVGRLAEEKNIFLLLSVWQKYFMNSEWTLRVIGGTQAEWEFILKKYSILANQKNFKYSSFAEPVIIRDAMRRAQVFILPSLFEPWGVVLHEAALQGCYLIASRMVGATDQFLLQEKNGQLIEPTLDGIVDALDALEHVSEQKFKQAEITSKNLARKVSYKETLRQLKSL